MCRVYRPTAKPPYTRLCHRYKGIGLHGAHVEGEYSG